MTILILSITGGWQIFQSEALHQLAVFQVAIETSPRGCQ